MKEATATYLKLIREMGEWYRLWQNALPSADAEYIDFVHGEYEIAKLKVREEETRLPQSR